MVPSAAIAFDGYAYEHGYTWVKAGDFEYEGGNFPRTDPEELLLVPAPWREEDRNALIRYQPEETLFLQASEVEPTPEDVLKFANRYGMLGVDGLWNVDRFRTWHHCLSELKDAIELQAVIQETRRKGETTMDRYLHWGHIRSPSLADAEWSFRIQVNSNLWGSLTSELTELPYLGEPRQSLVFKPSNLGKLLWLQLASAVAAGKRLRRCSECNRWLSMLPEPGDRTPRTTCSNRCRQHLYYRRRNEAISLHQHGKTIDEIYQAMDGIERESIAKWIKAGDKGKAGGRAAGR